MGVRFSPANRKLKKLKKYGFIQDYLQGKKKIYSFDLLSGHFCPYADSCLSKAMLNTLTGKKSILDGPNTKFRCFSASEEVAFPNVYNLRSANSKAIRACKTVPRMVQAIQAAMPDNLGVCRIHTAGDFFSQAYFNAWIWIARNNPFQLFYAYTKSLPYWIKRKNDIPSNLILTASLGGRCDHLINQNAFRTAQVVYSIEQAEALGLEIDHDDSHAANPELKEYDFALLIHGIQPKGSFAAKALKALRVAA